MTEHISEGVRPNVAAMETKFDEAAYREGLKVERAEYEKAQQEIPEGLPDDLVSQYRIVDFYRAQLRQLSESDPWEQQRIVITQHGAAKKRLAESWDQWMRSEEEEELYQKILGTNLREGVQKIPMEIGTHFDAHGIAKGSFAEQLTALFTVVSNGIDPERAFHTVPLRVGHDAGAAIGAGEVYQDGACILLGKPDKPLAGSGVGSVLVNHQLRDALPLLRAHFPEVQWIAPEHIAEQLQAQMLKASIEIP